MSTAQFFCLIGTIYLAGTLRPVTRFALAAIFFLGSIVAAIMGVK